MTNLGDGHEYENAYARQSFVDLYTVVYQEYEQDYEDRIVTVPLVGHDSEGGRGIGIILIIVVVDVIIITIIISIRVTVRSKHKKMYLQHLEASIKTENKL